jgi:hypothetical protein
MKSAQSSIEYLIVYGLALTLVLAVIFYLMQIDIPGLGRDMEHQSARLSCSLDELEIIGYKADTNYSWSIIVKNYRAEDEVKILNITFHKGFNDLEELPTIKFGREAKIDCNSAIFRCKHYIDGALGDAYSVNVRIDYNHTLPSGIVVGPKNIFCEVKGNLEAPIV